MFQTEKITRLAEVVFTEEGRVSISGQGILKKVFLSAYLSENGNQILPPREHFYFNRNKHVNIDTALVRKVSIYFILSEIEAEEQVRIWEQMIIQQASDQGLKFGDYGTFHYDGQLDFISETLYYYQFLPAVPYKSVGSNLHEFPAVEVATVEPVSAIKATKHKILMPAMWTLLVCLFGFAFYLWSGPLDLLIEQQTELNSRLVNVAPESYTNDRDTEYYNDTDDLSTDEHTTENGHGLENIGINKDYENENPPPALDENISLTEKKDDSMTGEGGPDILAGTLNEVSPRCTLIVGAFADAGNVERMVTRLGNYGLDVVTMERTTLTLVGASISCSSQATINTLRSEIDTNAWIYKK